MRCILIAAALIGSNPEDFDGLGYVDKLESGKREFLKQVSRNVSMKLDRGMGINDWDTVVTVERFEGDLAKTNVGYVKAESLDCGRE